MKNTLYVSNIASGVTEEQLRELFTQHGEVTDLQFIPDDKTPNQIALVTLASEKLATRALNNLNGHTLEGRYLTICPPEADLSKELLPKQRKIVESLAETLGETHEIPLRQLESIVMLCGGSFAQALLKEVEEIESQAGLMTADGARRRSKGGVFFYLARYRMPHQIRAIVYNRKGKLPEAGTKLMAEEGESAVSES